MNIHRLLSITGVKLQWGRWIIKPVLAMATSGAVALLMNRIPFIGALSRLPNLCIVGVAAVLLYGVLLIMTGCVTKEELRQTSFRKIN